jgi:hypothetical protein
MGIVYTNTMTLGNVAPVDPNAIYLPYLEDVASSTGSKLETWYGPAALRALGSAEAFDLHSERSKVSVIRKTVDGSDENRPQCLINYSYNLSSSDFGIQSPLGLEYRVVGSCRTEYSWLWPSPNATELRYIDYYHPFNLSELTFPAPGSSYPLSRMDFWAALNPLTPLLALNKTYALIAKTAHTASYTTSIDPWFLTETVSSSEFPQVGYQVKAGHPALSCWESNNFCLDEDCTGPLIDNTNIPKGS